VNGAEPGSGSGNGAVCGVVNGVTESGAESGAASCCRSPPACPSSPECDFGAPVTSLTPVQGPLNLQALMPLVGHQTTVYAGGELLCGEVDEREKANELNTGIWCCKTATFSDALY